MIQERILVVDDEDDLCEILKFNLEQAGYYVDTANSAEEALTMNVSNYNLILLDVMMGDMSGFQMASVLQNSPITSKIPIIFCTAKDSEDDTLKGLNIGADDYISKPFSVREVIARVKAVLRRTTQPTPKQEQKQESSQFVRHENLVIDTKKKTVAVKGVNVEVTKTEFEILLLLIQKINIVFSREELLRRVWNNKDVFVNDRTVDVHIARLRKKIEPYGKNIIARMRYGYSFKS